MQWTEIPRDQMRLPGEANFHTMTPYFRYENVFNEVQSHIAGRPIHEMKEVVEVRFAANPNYKPVFGVDEMYRMDDNGRIITWAERFKAQYEAFLSGSAQEAEGTPLEELLPYGISQAQLSICRAMSIYSIEALAHIEGHARKRMGLHGNDLIPMAQRYLENRKDGSQAQREIAELKRQLEALQGANSEPAEVSTALPEAAPTPEDAYAALTDDQVKEKIAEATGSRPRGNPSRSTLITMLETAQAA